MKINKAWLNDKSACNGGKKWFFEKYGENAEIEELKVLDDLIFDDELDYANWFIVRIMTREQYLKYAIFSAEQVIHIFEKKYPDDNRPRLAIEAAKKVLEDDSLENRNAAAAAYEAAAAEDAAADYAVYAAAAYAADADKKEMKLKILNYGKSLIA